MDRVCRLCLQKVSKGSVVFNINAVESFTGFMPYRDQLTTCIPELALDLVPNPVICNTCRIALKAAYDFKNNCLQVEDRIRSYAEKQPDINLLDIAHSFNVHSNSNNNNNNNSSTSSSTEPAVIIKPIKNEIVHEIEDVSEILEEPIDDDDLEEQLKKFHVEKIQKQLLGLDASTRMDRDVEPTRSPVKPNKFFVRQSEYICNFCHRKFKTLQYLRKHNSSCSKDNRKDVLATAAGKSVLTKRPHLPTRAKNRLKHWLFRHTEHPYPTDQEKQILMQETNLTLLQVENWFINARRRILQDLTKLKRQKLADLAGLEISACNPGGRNNPSISIKKEIVDW